MIEVSIHNLTKKKIRFKSLESLVSKLLKREGIKKASLSVVLMGAGRARELNLKYRKKSYIPDSLSFAGYEGDNELGEIVLCPQAIQDLAKKRGMSFQAAFNSSLIHSLLHLLGYDHKNIREGRLMEAKENKYLGLTTLVTTYN